MNRFRDPFIAKKKKLLINEFGNDPAENKYSKGHIISFVLHKIFIEHRRKAEIIFTKGSNDENEDFRSFLKDFIVYGFQIIINEKQNNIQCFIKNSESASSNLKFDSSVTSAIVRLFKKGLIDREKEFHLMLMKGDDITLYLCLKYFFEFANLLGFYHVDIKQHGNIMEFIFHKRNDKNLERKYTWPVPDYLKIKGWQLTSMCLHRIAKNEVNGAPIKVGEKTVFHPVRIENKKGHLMYIKNNKLERYEYISKDWSKKLQFIKSDDEDAQKEQPAYHSNKHSENLAETNGNGINLTVLGGGKEIGPNSYLLRIGNKKIVIDMGYGIGFDGKTVSFFPAFELINRCDAVFISHAHTDHIGSLLEFMSIFPDVPIYMTQETASCTEVSLTHHAGKNSSLRNLKTYGISTRIENSKLKSIDYKKNIRIVSYEEFVNINEVPCLSVIYRNAGHILGSANIEFLVGGRKIIYTGDFNDMDQAIEKKADFDTFDNCDVLISETTYGSSAHKKRLSPEDIIDNLASLINPVMSREGIVLFPVYSLGKCQELLVYLKKGISKNRIHVPSQNIYTVGLCLEFNKVFKKYSSNEIFDQSNELPIEIKNGFRDRIKLREYLDQLNQHLTDLKNKIGPFIILATHGMMQPGTASCSLANAMFKHPENKIVLTGYQAPRSYGYNLLKYVENRAKSNSYNKFINGYTKRRTNIRSEIDFTKISAHADRAGIVNLIRKMNSDKIVLVHGDPDSIKSIKKEVNVKLKSSATIFTPENKDTIQLCPLHLPKNFFSVHSYKDSTQIDYVNNPKQDPLLSSFSKIVVTFKGDVAENNDIDKKISFPKNDFFYKNIYPISKKKTVKVEMTILTESREIVKVDFDNKRSKIPMKTVEATFIPFCNVNSFYSLGLDKPIQLPKDRKHNHQDGGVSLEEIIKDESLWGIWEVELLYEKDTYYLGKLVRKIAHRNRELEERIIHEQFKRFYGINKREFEGTYVIWWTPQEKKVEIISDALKKGLIENRDYKLHNFWKINRFNNLTKKRFRVSKISFVPAINSKGKKMFKPVPVIQEIDGIKTELSEEEQNRIEFDKLINDELNMQELEVLVLNHELKKLKFETELIGYV